jgi:hypothetical protein
MAGPILTVDTHVHMLPSTTSLVDWDEIALLTRVAQARKIDVVCVTEHRHAAHYRELLDGLFRAPRLAGRLLPNGAFRCENGIVLMAGAEVAIAGGGDLGVHAEPDVLLELSPVKGAYSAASLLSTLAGAGRPFWVAAHHVYSQGKMIAGLAAVSSQLDALELPAKGLKDEAHYRALAVELGKPLVGSSDAHTWVQVGAGVTRFADLDAGAAIRDLKGAIGAGRAAPDYHPSAAELIEVSGLYRDAIGARADDRREVKP